jgi:hypothetical protein
MLPAEEIVKHTERGTIEIAPLAYMRGRTLNNAFIILDEAQNSTTEQMLMFLTRLGHGSKAVITGDETQVDLPPHKNSGLVEAHRALKHTRASRSWNFPSATWCGIRWCSASSRPTRRIAARRRPLRRNEHRHRQPPADEKNQHATACSERKSLANCLRN